MTYRPLLATVLAALLLGASPAPSPALNAAQREVLNRYLASLGSGRYDEAFGELTAEERRYFGTAAHFASAFAADRLKIGKYQVVSVKRAGSAGVVVIVSEHIEFFDHAHQATGTATARVAYGLINERDGVHVKDPYHPWLAFDPAHAEAVVNDLQIIVRKVSFFTGRVEFVITFVNRGNGAITLLPYGRSVLRDENGTVYHLIDTKLSTLTDQKLRQDPRLASSAEYTGALTFFTPDRFTPKTLKLSVGPHLRDGADAPFTVDIPALDVPS